MKFFARQSACLAGILAVIFTVMLLFPEAARAAGACSPDVGKVTLNEYNYIDNFTEVRKISSNSVDMTGWKVTVYTANRATAGALPADAGSSCFGGLYQVNQFNSNEISQNADIVLLDKNDDVVDIVRVRTSLPVAGGYYRSALGTPLPVPACSYISGPYDLLVSSSNKGVDRLPDGAGPWRNTPGTGNNSFQSRCGPNIVGGSADLAVTKAANFSSVVQGDSVTFTITVTNNGTGNATNVAVDDLIPNGTSYQSHLASIGTYDYVKGVWSIGTLAVGAKATLNVTVVTATTGTTASTITNTATVKSETYDPITTNNSSSVNVTANSPPSSRLDAVEPGTGPGTVQGSRIYTKLADVAFNLDLLALNTSGSTPVINAGYSKTVTIELVQGGDSSANCSSKTRLPESSTYTQAFSGSGAGKTNGRVTLALSYPYAASNVRIRMTDNSTPPLVSCSSDNFAIRPHALVVANTNATNADPNGVSISAAPAIKAGALFTLTATAVVPPGTTTVKYYDGAPAVINSKIIAHSGATTAGTVYGDFSNAVSGVSTGTAFQYSEVGYFKLPPYSVSDTTFTGVDRPGDCVMADPNNPDNLANFSNTAVGGKFGCDIGNPVGTNFIGRFYPYNYELTYPTETTFPQPFKNRNDISTCDMQTTGAIAASTNSLTIGSSSGYAVGDGIVVRGAGPSGTDLVTTVTAIAGVTFTLGANASTTVSSANVYRVGFSYEGEPMTLGFNITAYNGVSLPYGPSVTRNYTGDWARGSVVLQAESNNNGTDLSGRLAANTAPAWTEGIYKLRTNNFQFSRATTAPDGPFDNLQIGVAVNDPDGAVLVKRNMNPATTGDCNILGNCTAVAVANTRMLFGRLKLSNAHGSELLNLPIPAETQFWNGMLFVRNAADSCTSLDTSKISLAKTPTTCIAALSGIAQMIGGRTNLVLSKPGAACYVDLTVDLGTAAENKTYLQGKWTSTGYADNPRARATFGIYKRGPVIYMREMY